VRSLPPFFAMELEATELALLERHRRLCGESAAVRHGAHAGQLAGEGGEASSLVQEREVAERSRGVRIAHLDQHAIEIGEIERAVARLIEARVLIRQNGGELRAAAQAAGRGHVERLA